MKKTGARLVLIIALALVALAGSAYWLGIAVEQQARPALAALATSSGHGNHYQRGWFSTSTRSHWPLTDAASASLLPLTLQHTVYHGPLPLAQPWPALAYIETVPNLSNTHGWQAQINALYRGQRPFRLSSQIQLTGSTDHRLHITPLQFDAASIADLDIVTGIDNVRFAGATGQAQLSRNGQLFNAALSAPSLFLSSGDSAIELDDIAIELARLEDHTTAPSRTSNHYRFQLTLALREWRLASERLGPGRLTLTLTGLDPALLQAPPLPLAQAPGLALLWAAQSLMQAGPRLTLLAQLDTPRGSLRAQGEAQLQGVNIMHIGNPQNLLRSVFRTAEGEFVIGTELAAWLLPDARARLAPAREAGWLSLEQSDSGTLLRSRLKLDNGQLWLNGHAVP